MRRGPVCLSERLDGADVLESSWLYLFTLIALAHKYTSINLKPGGRVLDIMGRVAQRN